MLAAGIYRACVTYRKFANAMMASTCPASSCPQDLTDFPKSHVLETQMIGCDHSLRPCIQQTLIELCVPCSVLSPEDNGRNKTCAHGSSRWHVPDGGKPWVSPRPK